VKPRTGKALFAKKNVDIRLATRDASARWERYQMEFLNNETPFDITDKSRQIGWSFTAAMDAVCDGIIHEDTPHLFVSINKEEAAEKIRYARDIVAAIRPKYRPILTQDATFSLAFENGSRLISHPCRPPRGKARARIYLDEMAHYQPSLMQPVYTGALPATVRGDGYIRIGSSPLGAAGLFWEIFTQTLRKWPGYDGHRRTVPWWTSHALCKDVRLAARLAPQMTTHERVMTFGTEALVVQYENNFLEDFQQEFECAWVDEAVAWISWDLIQSIQKNDLQCWHSHSVDEALEHLTEVQNAVRMGQIELVLCGGIDVGRVHDLTEFVLLGKGPSGQLPCRWIVSLSNVEFRHQQTLFWHIINSLPITLVLVDMTGIGMQLSETLEQTGKAAGVYFTAPTKELLAVEARLQAESHNAQIPAIRDLIYQIHSIRKMPGAIVNRFDVEASEKHHADKFWAWALGLYAANVMVRLGQEKDEVVESIPGLGLEF